VFTARYGLSPYITQIGFVFKWLNDVSILEKKYLLIAKQLKK